MSRHLAIDTDVGVDDALALMFAWHHAEASIELITTVAGNVPIRTATRNARGLTGLLADVNRGSAVQQVPPIAQGASRPLRGALETATHVHGSDGLAGASALRHRDGRAILDVVLPPTRRDAVGRLVQAAERYGSELTIVALGPLTNIAHALERAPQAMGAVGRVVVKGGAVMVPGNITPVAEFNFYVDPWAAERVMGSGLPLTLVPLDVTQQVRLLSRRVSEAASGSASALAKLAVHFVRSGFGGRWRREGMPMHDPLAVAVALHPELVDTRAMAVQVETDGKLTRGQVITDRRPHAEAGERPFVDVALAVDATRAADLITGHLAGPHRSTASGQGDAVAVLGGSNVDFTVKAPRLPSPGETVQGNDLATGLGGKGANQAVAAARAGSPVHFFTSLGLDTGGGDFRAALADEGICLHEPPPAKQVPTGAALICVDDQGENLIAVAPGANRRFRWQSVPCSTTVLRQCKVLAGPMELPIVSITAAFRGAKRLGLTTILNAAPATPIPARLRRFVDILVVNETEAALLCDLPITTNSQARLALTRLHAQGYGCVILTLGPAGAIWTKDGRIHRQRGYKVRTVDTTGAGDTFVGYLASALARELPLASALDLAARAGALTVTRAGAQASVPKRARVERLRNEK